MLVAAIWFLNGALPATDPFSVAGPFPSRQLDRMSGQALAELKINHARHSDRFDIGVFGNSRSLNVSQADIGVDGCSFFNFSVGSESLRSSVAFLEFLADANRAPRIALVGVDHFELQRYNNPLFPPLAARWRLLARDLWSGVRRGDISLKELARMVWRHAIIESILFKQTFEIEFAISGVKNLLGVANVRAAPAEGEAFYRADGSRAPAAARLERRPESLLAPTSSQFLLGYLRSDLERLKQIQDRGVRVILFETFIHPPSARHFADNPSPYAAATRDRFLALCRELSLRCRAAPATVPFGDLPWVDYSHPPARSTGAHLKTLLTEDSRLCARDI